MSHPILQVKNLTKTYRSGKKVVHALKGISLSIEQGEIFGLLGVNGAGKTTLSSILATLHPICKGQPSCEGCYVWHPWDRAKQAPSHGGTEPGRLTIEPIPARRHPDVRLSKP